MTTNTRKSKGKAKLKPCGLPLVEDFADAVNEQTKQVTVTKKFANVTLYMSELELMNGLVSSIIERLETQEHSTLNFVNEYESDEDFISAYSNLKVQQYEVLNADHKKVNMFKVTFDLAISETEMKEGE